jgi:hypothetical protein
VVEKPLRWGHAPCTGPINPPVTPTCLIEQVIPPAQQSERRRISGPPPTARVAKAAFTRSLKSS